MDPLLLVMIVVLFGGMWFMSNRTRKQQQAAAAFRDNLLPGQEVMTGSGMYGTVVEVDGETIVLETSPGVETRWFKPAIAKLVEHPVDEDVDAQDEDEYDDEYDEDDDAEYDETGEDETAEDEAGEDADATPVDGDDGTDADQTRRA